MSINVEIVPKDRTWSTMVMVVNMLYALMRNKLLYEPNVTMVCYAFFAMRTKLSHESMGQLVA